MAASRQVRKRQEREAQTPPKKKGSRLLVVVAYIGVAIIILLSFVQYSGMMTRGLPAFKVGNTGYSVSNANYFYRNAFTTFYSSYEEILGNYLDPSKPLTAQNSIFDSSKTWAEYFWEGALSQAKQITALADSAKAEGYSLTQEEREEVSGWLDTLKKSAEESDYSYRNYIPLYFGNGNNEKTVRAMMEKSLLAERYHAYKRSNLQYDEAELAQYYEENRDTFDSVAYSYVLVSGAGEESEDGGNAEAAMAEALSKAQAITQAQGGLEGFRQAVLAYTGQQAVSTVTAKSSIDPVLLAWLTDSAREKGDSVYLETEGGYYALYFLESLDNHYNSVSVRHILKKAQDADADGQLSQEELDAAREAVEEIYDTWKESGADEDTFISLVGEHSDDGGSVENGGLYENITKYQMVDAFDEFCFQPHQYGDTAIVLGSSGSYAGYHLIFFVGEGEPVWKTQAENAKRETNLSAWMDELLEPYEVKETFMMKFVMDY